LNNQRSGEAVLDRKDFIDWNWPPASDNVNSAQQSVNSL
jgi:hypothetical protein